MVTHHRKFVAISVLAAALLPLPVRAGQTARPTVSREKLREQLEQQQQRIADCKDPFLKRPVSRGAGKVAPIGAAYFLPYLLARLNDQFMELG